MKKYKIMLSGGGTGGHIYPAIAIANALKEQLPEVEIQFVGASDRMEMQKVPEAGYDIKALWISGLQRKLTAKNLMFPLKVISSLLKSYGYLRKFKPDAVVGTGGFASGPLLWVASRLRIPSLIQEQNSYPGITNKMLASKVQKICVAYSGMERFFPKEKIVITGNPIRKELVNIEDKREEAKRFFHLDASKKTVLLIGGSLGSRAMNLFLKEHLQWFVDNNVQLLWQTGKLYYADCKAKWEESRFEQVQVHQFIKEMDLAYAAADLVVSRAGAIAISELAVAGKATVLIPSPNVAEDHQTKNAIAMTDKGAALMVREAEMKLKLLPMLRRLTENDEERDQLEKQIKELAAKDAADEIAKELIKLIAN
jgi:UDP-N-acetylglucosamine--N-acetylmuramyl-(pentapeptide) pyrophosphoryl-undecaprenol N-acetylglucosamine transferase